MSRYVARRVLCVYLAGILRLFCFRTVFFAPNWRYIYPPDFGEPISFRGLPRYFQKVHR